MTKVLDQMLFGNPADGQLATVRIGDRDPEYFLAHRNPQRVMSKSAMTKVTVVVLGLVEPLMDREVIGGNAAPLALTRDSMVKRRSHRRSPARVGVELARLLVGAELARGNIPRQRPANVEVAAEPAPLVVERLAERRGQPHV